MKLSIQIKSAIKDLFLCLYLQRDIIRSYLLAKLEDCESNGNDEREEGQLKCVPSLQSEDADSQGDEGHSLEEHEHQDGHDDLLELGLTGLANRAGTFLVELDVQAEFVVFQIPRAHGHFRVGDGQLEGDVVGADVVLHAVKEVTGGAAAEVAGGVVLCHLDGVGNLVAIRSLGIGSVYVNIILG